MGQQRITMKTVRLEDYLYPAFHYFIVPLFRSPLLSFVFCPLSSVICRLGSASDF
jgi:hypothetical protein